MYLTTKKKVHNISSYEIILNNYLILLFLLAIAVPIHGKNHK